MKGALDTNVMAYAEGRRDHARQALELIQRLPVGRRASSSDVGRVVQRARRKSQDSVVLAASAEAERRLLLSDDLFAALLTRS